MAKKNKKVKQNQKKVAASEIPAKKARTETRTNFSSILDFNFDVGLSAAKEPATAVVDLTDVAEKTLSNTNKIYKQPEFEAIDFEYNYDSEPEIAGLGMNIKESLARAKEVVKSRTVKEVTDEVKEDDDESMSEEEEKQNLTLDLPPKEVPEPREPTIKRDPSARPPWLLVHDKTREHVPSSPLLFLHNEILEFYAFIREKPEEHKQREQTSSLFIELIKNLYPDATITPFGSFTSGLCLPNSDIDIHVLVSDKPSEQLDAMSKIGKQIQYTIATTHLEIITNARIPIIKLTIEIPLGEEKRSQDIDISFGPKESIENDCATEALDKIPLARPFGLVLKYFFQQRGLNDTWTGGIGSHLTVLLVFATMQHFRRKVLDEMTSKDLDERLGKKLARAEDLGSLVLEFFDLHSQTFNSHALVISLLNGGTYTAKSLPDDEKRAGYGHLSLLNPADEEIDTGKGFFMHTRCRKLIQNSFMMLSRNLNRHDDYRDKKYPTSILQALIKVDKTILDRHARFYGIAS